MHIHNEVFLAFDIVSTLEYTTNVMKRLTPRGGRRNNRIEGRQSDTRRKELRKRRQVRSELQPGIFVASFLVPSQLNRDDAHVSRFVLSFRLARVRRARLAS